MPTYWLIKALLILALIGLSLLVIRPARSANHLAIRRLGMMTIITFAFFAILFPHLLNDLAHLLGVERGINLLVYALVVAFFTQMATTYRRDADAEQRITQLARAIAIANAENPQDSPSKYEEQATSVDSGFHSDTSNK